LAWDIVCFGRPASELPFRTGELASSLEILREGAPLSIERTVVRGGSAVLESAWGYGGLPVFGAFYCVPAEASALGEWVDGLRAELGAMTAHFAVTALDELIVLRAGAGSVESVRALFGRAWQFLRPKVLGRTAVTPRIWHV
jgi:urease accessory protein